MEINRAIITETGHWNTDSAYIGVKFLDGENEVTYFNIEFPSGNLENEREYHAAAEAALAAYAAQQSYNLSGGVLWVPRRAPMVHSSSRALDTAFKISDARDASVTYTTNITLTPALLSPVQGTQYLEYADDDGFTTNVVEVCRRGFGNTGTVVGLGTLNSIGTLSGFIPAEKWVRVRSQNNVGTPAHAFISSQEVLL